MTENFTAMKDLLIVNNHRLLLTKKNILHDKLFNKLD